MKRWEIYLEIILELILCAGGLFLLVFGLPKMLGFFWPFVVAWIVALLAGPLCNFLERRLKVSRKWGSMLIIIFSIALVGGMISFLVYTIGSQAVRWAVELPSAYANMLQNLEKAGAGLADYHFPAIPFLANGFSHLLGELKELASSFVSAIGSYGVKHAGSMAKSFTNGLIGVIVMLIAASLMICNREDILAAYKKITPDFVKEKVDIFCKNTLGVLVDYCVVQLKLMVVIAFILFAGFLILKIPYAVLFAFLISLLDVLPFLGTGMVLIPWGIYMAVTGHIGTCVGFLILYVLCLVLKQVLQPKMLGDRMELDSLVTLILMYAGLKLKGISGLIYALIFGIFFTNLYKRGVFDSLINRYKNRFTKLHELDQKNK